MLIARERKTAISIPHHTIIINETEFPVLEFLRYFLEELYSSFLFRLFPFRSEISSNHVRVREQACQRKSCNIWWNRDRRRVSVLSGPRRCSWIHALRRFTRLRRLSSAERLHGPITAENVFGFYDRFTFRRSLFRSSTFVA